MGLITQTVKVKVSNQVGTHYKNKGYVLPTHITRNKQCVIRGAEIEVKVWDLTDNSQADIEYECDCCHKIVHTTWIKYRHSKNYQSDKTFCRKCRMTVDNSGSNHPSYNAELSVTDRINHRCYTEYNTLKNAVKQRDQYTCVACGFHSINDIVVHHLYSYTDYEEYRTDINYSVCLCDKCHKSFHSYYWGKEITPSNFMKWKNDNQNYLAQGRSAPRRSIYCFEDNLIIEDIYEHLSRSDACSVVKCANGQLSVWHDKHYVWFDEVRHLSADELNELLYHKLCAQKSKSIICLETKQVYKNIESASNFIKISVGAIRYSLQNTSNTCGKIVYGKPLHFMYLHEYKKTHNIPMTANLKDFQYCY